MLLLINTLSPMISHLENSIALKSVSFKGVVLDVGTSTLSGFLTSQVGQGVIALEGVEKL